MGFWEKFEIVYSYVWDFIDTPMNFGGISISFMDLLIVSGVCTVICQIVRSIIHDVGD